MAAPARMRPDIQRKLCRLAHFRRRLLEHYGISLTKSLIGELHFAIQKNVKVRFMWGSPGSQKMAYTVDTRQGSIAVVYDSKRQELVTALPRTAVQ